MSMNFFQEQSSKSFYKVFLADFYIKFTYTVDNYGPDYIVAIWSFAIKQFTLKSFFSDIGSIIIFLFCS